MRRCFGDHLPGKKARGEMGDVVSAKIACGELLDDLLEYGESNIRPSTARIVCEQSCTETQPGVC
jgi:hypothetical protein